MADQLTNQLVQTTCSGSIYAITRKSGQRVTKLCLTGALHALLLLKYIIQLFCINWMQKSKVCVMNYKRGVDAKHWSALKEHSHTRTHTHTTNMPTPHRSNYKNGQHGPLLRFLRRRRFVRPPVSNDGTKATQLHEWLMMSLTPTRWLPLPLTLTELRGNKTHLP